MEDEYAVEKPALSIPIFRTMSILDWVF